MNNLKSKLLSKIVDDNIDYSAKNKKAISSTEGRRANAKVILKLLRYMKENNLKQNDLAIKLSVSPQYINKLLRAQTNLGIDTAINYGKILGIKLITIPDDYENEVIEERTYSFLIIKDCLTPNDLLPKHNKGQLKNLVKTPSTNYEYEYNRVC